MQNMKKSVIKASLQKSKKPDEHVEFKTVRANYNFISEGKNEISLKKGDIIRVTDKIDEGWWIGTCNGKSGMFPSNYVTVIDGNDNNSQLQSSDVKLSSQEKSIETEYDQKSVQANQKPEFSYLPQGTTPITFIGRGGQAQQPKDIKEVVENITAACSQCDCEEFAANIFKHGRCNNCFHKH